MPAETPSAKSHVLGPRVDVDGRVDDFNREFTELFNTYCWNDVWTGRAAAQDALGANLGMLIALGKEHELKLHLNGRPEQRPHEGRDQGVCCQTAIYCGVAAAVGGVPLRQGSIQ